MIDLKQFCSTDLTRYYLNEPWTRDGFTYATNGHILVRVPARADIAKQPKAPDITKIPWPKNVAFVIAPVPVLPPVETVECEACDGRGFEHECPDCECECEDCGGTSYVTTDHKTSIYFYDNFFSLQYIRQLTSLPSLRVGHSETAAAPMPFEFEGGDGLLMPLRNKRLRHVLPDGSIE